jgi:predicted transposase YdaD
MANQDAINHDRLFKELISTFFLEFLELFFPQVLDYLKPESVTFQDKEVFTDVTRGERYETDLLAQVQFLGEKSYFLIHLENQASSQSNFNQRMFRYFARLHEKFNLPIYPIVIFSYDQPKKQAINYYQVEFPDFQVLQFNYRVIQLNRLNWRDFLNQANPIACALMAKMNIAPAERPRVKLECLRLLTTLQLDPARMQLISGFVDTYLRLTARELEVFNQEFEQIEPTIVKEEIMEITTSWKEEGKREGKQEGKQELILNLVTYRLGKLSSQTQTEIMSLNSSQLDELGLALFNLENEQDLRRWLANSVGNN